MFLYECVGPNIIESSPKKNEQGTQLLALFMFYKYVGCYYLEMYFCFWYTVEIFTFSFVFGQTIRVSLVYMKRDMTVEQNTKIHKY